MEHTKTNIENKLGAFFKEWSGKRPDSILKLPHSGSNRTYYRLTYKNSSAIGVYNDNPEENRAFISYTKQLKEARINVPSIYSTDLIDHVYLIEDVGDNQLLSWLLKQKNENRFSNTVVNIYKRVIQDLVRIQIIAGRNFDYASCYQYANFNKDSIIFDLNYFKTRFADTFKFDYSLTALNKDFETFANYLLNADNNFFMFRDFQARNIHLLYGEPYYIDYQGGRKGPLQYDLASLLFQAKAQIPELIKNLLLDYYIKLARMFVPINPEEFSEYFFGFALIRVLQTLGAYGLRGLVENKTHFVESIPLAINNLFYLQDKTQILNKLPELNQLIDQVIKSKYNGK